MARRDEKLSRDLGARLRELRRERGMTQETLAERIGMEVGNYAHVEQGIEPDHLDARAVRFGARRSGSRALARAARSLRRERTTARDARGDAAEGDIEAGRAPRASDGRRRRTRRCRAHRGGAEGSDVAQEHRAPHALKDSPTASTRASATEEPQRDSIHEQVVDRRRRRGSHPSLEDGDVFARGDARRVIRRKREPARLEEVNQSVGEALRSTFRSTLAAVLLRESPCHS